MKPPNQIANETIEKPFFETISLILAFVMGYISIQSYVNIGLSYLLVADLILVIVGIVFYVLSKRLGQFSRGRYLFILLVFIACSYFWFWLDGITGSTPFAIIAGAVVAVLIIDKKYRKILTGLILTWILSLVLIQRNTEWVYQRENEKELVSNNFIIFSFAIIIILHYLKSRYDAERDRVNNKNLELAKLNQTLNNTLHEKEEIIRELRKAREDLLESEKLASIGKLTAGLAHKLNNPLNYIGGVVTPLSNNLKELYEGLNHEQKQASEAIIAENQILLETLKEGSQKASEVIKNLVRISPKSTQNKPTVFSLGEVLVDNLQILNKTHPDISIKQSIDPELKIAGNPMEIRQLCTQLLHNSATSMDGMQDKSIDLSIKKVDKSLVLEITDNGVGIPPEDQSKVFEPFFSSDKSQEGKGIGLYMSYATVKKHFGEIRLESEPGVGTTVSVFLPLA
jgi:signal transduction histidine kinase